VRIGLALAAGGSVGVAYHGAVLAALEEETGWDPRRADVLVGTSAGSVSSAMLRAGVPASDLARISEGEELSEEGRRLAEIGRPHRPRPTPWDALAFRPVSDPVGLLRGLTRPWAASAKALILAALPSGGISTDALSGGIDTVYGDSWPERPLWLCSYDLRAGRRVVFGRPGNPPARVGQAVAASCAIPMYFRPVVIGGRRYVDGGVHSMVNLDLLADRDLGLDLVLAVSPMSQAAAWGAVSPAMLMRQPLRARLGTEVAALKRTGVPVVAIQPGRTVTSVMGINPMDAARRGIVSRATREGVSRWLRDGTEGRQLARILRQAAESGGATPVPAPGVQQGLA
jgi:NTE family protein